MKSYVSESAQTEWRFPTNAATQYEPREFDEETRQQLATSETLAQMAEAVLPRFDLGLQHNEVTNAFTDDWGNLAVEETTFGSKSDSYLKVGSFEADYRNDLSKMPKTDRCSKATKFTEVLIKSTFISRSWRYGGLEMKR